MVFRLFSARGPIALLACPAAACGLAGLLLGCATTSPERKPPVAPSAPTAPSAAPDRAAPIHRDTAPSPTSPAPTAAPAPAVPPATASPTPPSISPTTPIGPVASPFPHIRIDKDRREVLISGKIAVDVHDPETPRVWLEVIACSPDSKEHEALVVTPALASHIHACLLLLGAEPGEPGRVEWDGSKPQMIEPKGPAVEVSFRLGVAEPNAKSPSSNDNPPASPGSLTTRTPADWINLASTGKPPSDLTFCFAGSGFLKPGRDGAPRYAADSAGTLVGLTTFGTETIAAKQVYSPDSGLQAPEFLASSNLPPMGTPVELILRLIK